MESEASHGEDEDVEPTASTWEERLWDVDGLGFRATSFLAVSEVEGLFRVMPVALRLLRIAGGRTQEAVGTALGVEAATIEAIERGCIEPRLPEIDRWLGKCGSGISDVAAANGAATALWPVGERILRLPRFWGPLRPRDEDFVAARTLIERLGGRGVEGEAGVAVPAEESGPWLERFFRHLDEEVSPQLAATAPRAGLSELSGTEPLTVTRWWSRALALWFNLYLVCQAPIGVRFFDVRLSQEES